MTIEENSVANQASNLVVDILDHYFENKTFTDSYTSQDLLYTVTILKGLLQNFETLEMAQIDRALSYIHKTIYSHT
jgi:hypothetical protein